MYCHREPRFYVTVNFSGAYFPSEDRQYNFFNGGADNNHTHDAPQSGYLMRKRVNPKDNIKQGSYNYRPGIIYRLAEAYSAMPRRSTSATRQPGDPHLSQQDP